MDPGFTKSVRSFLAELETHSGSIEDLAALAATAINMPDDVADKAKHEWLKSVVRREIKTLRDKDGLAQWESIERETEDGKTERVYAQLSLFNKEEFRRVVDYYTSRTSYYGRKTNSLVERFNKQFDSQLPLPFPEFGTLEEGESAA